ncbi:MAG: response regulator, partial [Pseudomonadales bacterium]|nr:response regulator [Pseudomonadales bacterium]
GGTGLGLAITKLLVTLMGGQVTVSSKAGSGSCFDFFINIAKVDPFVEACDSDDVGSVPVVSEVRRKAVRVLVAEDNIVNQKVISKMLKNLHYEHDLAVNGVEAVSKSDKRHYDLILMDLQMPELSGLEAADRILATCSEGAKCCPVIVALTANVLEDDRIRCEQAGMSGFLAKPVKQKDLEDCLNRLLGGSVMTEPPLRMR